MWPVGRLTVSAAGPDQGWLGMPEIVKSGRFLMFTLKLSAAQQSVQQSAIMALLRCTSLAKLLPSASRAFSATAGNPFGDAGKGAEEVYFNKEERVRADVALPPSFSSMGRGQAAAG